MYIMLVTPKEQENIKKIKQNPKNLHVCPICKGKFKIGVEYAIKTKLHGTQRFPYPHIHLHGNPLHGMLCYLDSEFKIRSVSGIESIEVLRDSDTLNQVMKKWSNPS